MLYRDVDAALKISSSVAHSAVSAAFSFSGKPPSGGFNTRTRLGCLSYARHTAASASRASAAVSLLAALLEHEYAAMAPSAVVCK